MLLCPYLRLDYTDHCHCDGHIKAMPDCGATTHDFPYESKLFISSPYNRYGTPDQGQLFPVVGYKGQPSIRGSNILPVNKQKQGGQHVWFSGSACLLEFFCILDNNEMLVNKILVQCCQSWGIFMVWCISVEFDDSWTNPATVTKHIIRVFCGTNLVFSWWLY